MNIRSLFTTKPAKCKLTCQGDFAADPQIQKLEEPISYQRINFLTINSNEPELHQKLIEHSEHYA